MNHTPFYYLSMFGLFASAVGVVYLTIFNLLPFEFYVDIKEVEVSDLCVGDQYQEVKATRTPRWEMSGKVEASRVIRFDNQQRIETTILRENVPFVYEANDFAQYEIRWNKPIEIEGMYAYDELQTIYPLPLIKKTEFIENVAEYEVYECE